MTLFGAFDIFQHMTSSIIMVPLIWENLPLFEPRREKICLQGFQPGPTQNGLYRHGWWLEAWNFRVWKKREYTIQIAKTKALISFAVTAKLICVFVFAYAKNRFPHVEAYLESSTKKKMTNIQKLHVFLCICTGKMSPIMRKQAF